MGHSKEKSKNHFFTFKTANFTVPLRPTWQAPCFSWDPGPALPYASPIGALYHPLNLDPSSAERRVARGKRVNGDAGLGSLLRLKWGGPGFLKISPAKGLQNLFLWMLNVTEDTARNWLIKFPKSRPEHTDSGSKESLSTFRTESRALACSPPGRCPFLSSGFSKAQ